MKPENDYWLKIKQLRTTLSFFFQRPPKTSLKAPNTELLLAMILSLLFGTERVTFTADILSCSVFFSCLSFIWKCFEILNFFSTKIFDMFILHHRGEVGLTERRKIIYKWLKSVSTHTYCWKKKKNIFLEFNKTNYNFNSFISIYKRIVFLYILFLSLLPRQSENVNTKIRKLSYSSCLRSPGAEFLILNGLVLFYQVPSTKSI